MNIGIIVHSQTGHTHSVARKLMEKLIAAGHSANLERVTSVGNVHPGAKDIQLETRPEVDTYDALVFGAPVYGFSLSPVIASYLSQLVSLTSKKVACVVTQFFPFPWMGGNRAIGQMKEICESKGAEVLGSAVVNWSSLHRNRQIIESVDRLSGLF